MYQTQKQTKYYVYNCIKQAYLYVAEDWEDLIGWIAQWNYIPFYSEKKRSNRILDDYNCTMKDVGMQCDWTWTKYGLREYTVFDDDFRIVDMRLYEKEILAYKRPKSFNHKYKNKALEYKYEKTKPEFRNGPVPRTGKRGWYCGIRHPKTLNEIKQNCDVEYSQYVRKSRKHLPTAWDDIFRSTPRCWKDQSKKKKQWM